MKIYFAERNITPEIGIELVGFTPTRLSDGVEKDLKVKVLVLTKGEDCYGVLVADLRGLDLHFKNKLLDKLKENGHNFRDLQIFATHTHSGPHCLSEEEYKRDKTDKKSNFI